MVYEVQTGGRRATESRLEFEACPGSADGHLPGFLLVGLSHRTAPVEIRERFSIAKESLTETLSLLRKAVAECIILSTCNRTEIYCVTNEPGACGEEIRRFMALRHGIAQDEAAPFWYEKGGMDAARHLFKVSGGLDSMILGEPQILGQVREALSAAAKIEPGRVPLTLSRLFHRALGAGRRVREETDLGRGPASVGAAAVDLVQRVKGNIRDCKVLLIGAGEAGQLAARALESAGVEHLTVANRTLERGQDLARKVGGSAISFIELPDAISGADVVISATDAPGFVVTTDMIQQAGRQRAASPLLLLDLAVPRDIEPQVAALPNIKLFDIDHLRSIGPTFQYGGNPDALGPEGGDLEGEESQCEAAALAKAERIVEEEVSKFRSWCLSLQAVPQIRRLQEEAESIRQREVARSLRKMPGFSAQQMEVVDTLTRSIVKKLLSDSIASLKSGFRVPNAGPVARTVDDSADIAFAPREEVSKSPDDWEIDPRAGIAIAQTD